MICVVKMTKNCTKCDIKYPRTKEYFALDKRRNDGLGSWCRKCDNNRSITWRKKHPEYLKKHYQKNKEYHKIYDKEYSKTFRGHITQLVCAIRKRCTNPNQMGYKYYGGRGIKCLFTSRELYDWIITNKIDPKGLEIHRIDNDGNYTLDNIVFLSRNMHIKAHNIKTKNHLLG